MQKKSGSTVKRHLRQEQLDKMAEASRSRRARADIKVRQHLMERSYARGTRYGHDRARQRDTTGSEEKIRNDCFFSEKACHLYGWSGDEGIHAG